MPFKKQFQKDDFLEVLDNIYWVKTGVIAKKVGTTNTNVTQTLLNFPEVEWQWTKGGKQGTREWRLKELK